MPAAHSSASIAGAFALAGAVGAALHVWLGATATPADAAGSQTRGRVALEHVDSRGTPRVRLGLSGPDEEYVYLYMMDPAGRNRLEILVGPDQRDLPVIRAVDPRTRDVLAELDIAAWGDEMARLHREVDTLSRRIRAGGGQNLPRIDPLPPTDLPLPRGVDPACPKCDVATSYDTEALADMIFALADQVEAVRREVNKLASP